VLSSLVTQPLETVLETTLANVYKIVIVMTALDVLSTNVSATTLAKQQILIATPFSQTELVLWIPITPQVMQLDMQFTQTTPTPTLLKLMEMDFLHHQQEFRETVTNLLVMQDNQALTLAFQEERTMGTILVNV
jgi:BarA-like signal transduction histidine kinase